MNGRERPSQTSNWSRNGRAKRVPTDAVNTHVASTTIRHRDQSQGSPLRLIGWPLRSPARTAHGPRYDVLLLTRTHDQLENVLRVQPDVLKGRHEGTDVFLGRRAQALPAHPG